VVDDHADGAAGRCRSPTAASSSRRR
jgi:hypothetical protein